MKTRLGFALYEGLLTAFSEFSQLLVVGILRRNRSAYRPLEQCPVQFAIAIATCERPASSDFVSFK